ncbi:MAG: hypothetical protein EOM23_10085 [Candidatus Moranbacteria bacterium]|nr:hypothetical protein [Candidatus Moranbacteria bacterium]
MIKQEDYIHQYFGLTYASYLILQRSVMQSMPVKWQKKFVTLLEELDHATNKLTDLPPMYTVNARDGARFIHDKYADYERGRRRVKLKYN